MVFHVYPDEGTGVVGLLDDAAQVLTEDLLTDVQSELRGLDRQHHREVGGCDVGQQLAVGVGVRVGGAALVVVFAEQIQNRADAVLVEPSRVFQGDGGRFASDEPARQRGQHTRNFCAAK